MTVPRDDILRTLIHDPAAPIPLLPKLRTLGFHAWYSTTTIVRLDLDVLIRVIQSRTSAPADQEGRIGGALQETIFVYTSDWGIHQAIFVDDFISRFDRGFDPALDHTTRSVVAAFGRDLTEEGFSFWRNDPEVFSPKGSRENGGSNTKC
ncbi:hypothetical protein FA13DRAFT_312936 [Coprinellus micaceus]|uniref:Uncharacterized protein n=1 Tax=Coprinellus micaceus TaxID=71717 RepID=A0A4Y7TCH4_COPMI|nr:hypothetical protein FA13DRAFT_312936 [Coprinellus micaceus]